MKTALHTAAFLCLILLFVGGPGYSSPRSAIQLWNFGHIPAFAVWASILLAHLNRRTFLPAGRQFLLLLLAVAVLGLGTEAIQSTIPGRDASLEDILRDIVGGVVAFSFFNPALRRLHEKKLKAIRVTAIILTAVAFAPVALAVTDEIIAKIQFPLLADFETPFEKSRWQKNEGMKVSQRHARNGKSSLEVTLRTGKYSGANLRYFPADWSPFNNLKLEILNQAQEPIIITCRINDRSHTDTLKDRFNRSYSLESGWNSITIPLIDVKKAPEGREMKMTEIESLQIFAANLKKPQTINLDSLRLSQ